MRYLEANGVEVLGTQVSIRTVAGRTVVDILGQSGGQVQLYEVKNGPSASLNDNQILNYDEIVNSGGVVVGKNGVNAGFPSGEEIPPTPVNVMKYDVNPPVIVPEEIPIEIPDILIL